MRKAKINLEVKRDLLSLDSGIGIIIRGRECGLRTSQGTSNPLRKNRRSSSLSHQVHIRRLSPSAVEFWQSLRNPGRGLEISKICMLDGEMTFEGAGWRVAHHELFRKEQYFGGYSISTGGFFASVPGTQGDFGLSEDWPFPGIFFTHAERGTFLVAVLSQERCKPRWQLGVRGNKATLKAEELIAGVPCISVGKGRGWTSERWVAISVQGGIEDAVEEYYRLLRKRISFHGTNSILRRSVVWGTWNYNFRPKSFMDIDHNMVKANATALSKLARGKPAFVVIDDGYMHGRSKDVLTDDFFASCFEIFHDGGNPPHDPALFPRGMKGIADDIRKAGCHPGLWVTIRIHKESALFKAHPEWMLQVEGRDDGFGRRTAYLDYSIPEARDFTRKAWRTVFQDWGYEGLKLDFWSIPFEAPQVRYRNPGHTAVELRNLFLQDLREFIPKNGFVFTAVVVNGGGNPFAGRYLDGMRMGADISAGRVDEVVLCAQYLTAASPFYRHDCLLADPDSIGWCPKDTAGQNRLWATIALMSGAVCEIAGDLTNPSPEAKELLQKVIRLHRPRLRTINNFASGALNNLPSSHVVSESDDGVLEAYLNWSLMPMEINLPQPVRDIWTGAKIPRQHRIPPQDAILFKR